MVVSDKIELAKNCFTDIRKSGRNTYQKYNYAELSDINPIVDYRSQGPDQGAKPGSIGAINQTGEILGERIKHNTGRNVRDQLAQSDRPPVFLPGHVCLQEPCNDRVSGDGG